MKKSSARQKKNYDLKNAMPMKLSVTDLVLKIKQKNLSRKGGRLDDRTEEQLFHVESIMSNGNLKLMGEKSKEMYPHFIPLIQVKRFLLKKRSCPTSPKYVQTNLKVPKTAINCTIAMLSPSASGSPSTSKFVACNTTLTSPKNVQMNAKVSNTVTNPSASVSLSTSKFIAPSTTLTSLKNAEPMQKYQIQLQTPPLPFHLHVHLDLHLHPTLSHAVQLLHYLLDILHKLIQ